MPTSQASQEVRLTRGRTILAAVGAFALGLLFLVSGLWKVTDLDATAERMVQLLVPVPLSLPGAFLVATGEMLAAVLLFMPSCRRWGAWLAGLLLAVFMAYMGIFYNRLLGADCSCFPWVRRVVGPAFFIGDAVMLAVAVAAGVWSRKNGNLRTAALALVGVLLVVAGGYSASLVHRAHADVPQTAIVDNKPLRLQTGRVLLYFFDPQCSHCEAVACKMAKWNWGETRIIAVPTAEPRFAASFLKDTGLRAGLCLDLDALRRISPFTTAPHAVLLASGKRVASFNFKQFEGDGFLAALKQSGHVI